jgi:hypothetical protein
MTSTIANIISHLSNLLGDSSSSLDVPQECDATEGEDDILNDEYIHAIPKATVKTHMKFTFAGRGTPPSLRDIEYDQYEIADQSE